MVLDKKDLFHPGFSPESSLM